MTKLATTPDQQHGHPQGEWAWGHGWRSLLYYGGLGLLFGMAYTQDPIFNSPENQNTKYFHGFARAGHGFLQEDWLATTLDPLPAFTALVQFTYQFFHPEYAFYAYYIAIFALYIYSLMGIVAILYPALRQRTAVWIFLALFFLIHIVHIELWGFDTGWELHAGVAKQYILGPVFQPANFGVFILLSILLFLRQQPFWAVGLLAIAVTLHPAYFPSVAALTGTYMLVQWWTRDRPGRKLLAGLRRPVAMGLLATVLMLPVYLYMTLVFQDTTPELAQQATDIIVNQRIPHHSIPAVWLANNRAYVQAGVVAIALGLSRRRSLAVILAIPFGLAVGLTALQVQLDSDLLAFVAPWRMSVFLVPIATSIILGWIATALARQVPATPSARQRLVAGCLVVLTAVIVGGSREQVQKFTTQDDTLAMLTAVRQTAQSGEVYLVPPESRPLRKFRLHTGAAIFINRKSHPYKDTEVIEWNQRLSLAKQVYAGPANAAQCRLLRQTLVGDYGVTHVVWPTEQRSQPCKGFQQVYGDAHYRVDRRRRQPS